MAKRSAAIHFSMSGNTTLILGIETSCDETSAAVVADGRGVRSNVVASQVDIHRRYGGVFPEMASRQHVLSILPVIEEALIEADVGWSDLSATPPEFPAVCLVVSGGHTELLLMSGHGQYRRLGGTLDDAAGEAFDKVGRLLGLPYPGGPAIEEAARTGTATAFNLPRAWLRDTYDFSFSGLKTAVLRIAQKYQHQTSTKPAPKPRAVSSQAPPIIRVLPVANLAASFQTAVVEVLVEKTRRAAKQFQAKTVLLAGGVAANEYLRTEMADKIAIPLRYPPPELCTDNAAMVASTGFFRFSPPPVGAGEQADWDLDVVPSLRLA